MDFEEQEFYGHKYGDIMQLLQEYDWNWFVVADNIDCDPMILKETFIQYLPFSQEVSNEPIPFDSSHITAENVKKIQDFTKTFLTDTLPLLFNENLTEDAQKDIAKDILIDMGLPYKITHAPEFHDTYKLLEDEALSLAQWRSQVNYLTVLEEALFKISATLLKAEEAENSKPREESTDLIASLDAQTEILDFD